MHTYIHTYTYTYIYIYIYNWVQATLWTRHSISSFIYYLYKLVCLPRSQQESLRKFFIEFSLVDSLLFDMYLLNGAVNLLGSNKWLIWEIGLPLWCVNLHRPKFQELLYVFSHLIYLLFTFDTYLHITSRKWNLATEISDQIYSVAISHRNSDQTFFVANWDQICHWIYT